MPQVLQILEGATNEKKIENSYKTEKEQLIKGKGKARSARKSCGATRSLKMALWVVHNC